MPDEKVTRSLLLPELELTDAFSARRTWVKYYVKKTSRMEVCPKCAVPSESVYDHRDVVVKDAPVRAHRVP